MLKNNQVWRPISMNSPRNLHKQHPENPNI
jgi:hypothetical protein